MTLGELCAREPVGGYVRSCRRRVYNAGLWQPGFQTPSSPDPWHGSGTRGKSKRLEAVVHRWPGLRRRIWASDPDPVLDPDLDPAALGLHQHERKRSQIECGDGLNCDLNQTSTLHLVHLDDHDSAGSDMRRSPGLCPKIRSPSASVGQSNAPILGRR